MANILVCDDDREIVDAIEIYLLQEGYTIYECSRCGEQNRTTSGVGPPPSGGGDSPGREQDASI